MLILFTPERAKGLQSFDVACDFSVRLVASL